MQGDVNKTSPEVQREKLDDTGGIDDARKKGLDQVESEKKEQGEGQRAPDDERKGPGHDAGQDDGSRSGLPT